MFILGHLDQMEFVIYDIESKQRYTRPLIGHVNTADSPIDETL